MKIHHQGARLYWLVLGTLMQYCSSIFIRDEMPMPHHTMQFWGLLLLLYDNARYHAACANHETIQKLNRNFLVTHTTTQTSPWQMFLWWCRGWTCGYDSSWPRLHCRFSEAGEMMEKCINALEEYVGKFQVPHFNYCLLWFLLLFVTYLITPPRSLSGSKT